jgi:hypothetical protein
MKLRALSGSNEVNNVACLYGCYGNKFLPNPLSSNIHMIHFQRNKYQYLKISLSYYNTCGYWEQFKLNRYNMHYIVRQAAQQLCPRIKKITFHAFSFRLRELKIIFVPGVVTVYLFMAN